MKYIISRSSGGREKPCPEAVIEEHTYLDYRTVKTIKAARHPRYAHWAKDWFAGGSNHREDKASGMIVRDTELRPIWIVDLADDELFDFALKHGDIIIMPNESNYIGVSHTIEIYDGYRE